MQIGKMLVGREPKLVNGPEILNKVRLQLFLDLGWCDATFIQYVGESEANVRALFADAEAEYKQKGAMKLSHIDSVLTVLMQVRPARSTSSSSTRLMLSASSAALCREALAFRLLLVL